MEIDEEKGKIRHLAQRVRETETPGKHGAAYCYTRAAYAAFHEIVELREERFTLAAICKVMERDGLLPEHANPHSFRRAFKKELASREKAAKVQR